LPWGSLMLYVALVVAAAADSFVRGQSYPRFP
jgi:hypothetical protein